MQVVAGHTLADHLPSSCDPRFRAILVKCWAPVAADRPSAAEVTKMLRDLLDTL